MGARWRGGELLLRLGNPGLDIRFSPGSGPSLTIGWALAPDRSVNAPATRDAALQGAAKEVAGRHMLAAVLRWCSLFTDSELQSYKRDLVLWPLPPSYTRHNSKDFEALLADASKLPNLKELLQSPGDEDEWARGLVSWILSSKVLTIHSAGKTEFVKIQQLTGAPHTPVPTPDFLFAIAYFEPANSKFYETK